MSPRDRILTVRIDSDISEAMEAQQEKHGTSVSEQVRRALRMWLESQGVLEKADRKRAATRKRS